MEKASPAQALPCETRGALCAHFGECGGCQAQDVAYPEQLRRKEAELRELFAPYWDAAIPVEASPLVWHYRNRVDFNFALKRYPEPPPPDFPRETVLGFNRKGKWYWPLDIGECRIAPEGTEALLDAVRRWYASEGLGAFDSRSRAGFLRVLLLREGKRTGETMAALITSPGEFDAGSFVDAVLSVYPATTIYRGVSRSLARGAFADEMELLHGEPAITERLQVPDGEGTRELNFRVSPFSFFQTNTLAAEILYGKVRQWVRETAPDVLYDLYGGSGGIALACADLAQIVRSVDNAGSATEDGRFNATANGVENVFFTGEKMKNYLLKIVNDGGMEQNSAAIVDPPRAGMTPKALKRLLKSRPLHILYVSCNPSVFAQELPAFLESYRLTGLEAVDMFPHTPHVELLARLSRV